ncbi:MAG: CinA family nicotinamide mononucleotide deamidase-related protein [Desulfobacter sp.]|uniref:CinA family nicotinamide mononucleotide deamidase-related protein n=1 Tax=Desulfobacter sp. TaxID=2294 RepID=UPI001B48CFD3|nr:CinA family nicotinamide mononucleotide deamidase-related protein [Desulfobacter sp.]MBP8828188.1 CinA family nicotinamide mononucleotide deamidase-related protein [Desulfobacter sp.]
MINGHVLSTGNEVLLGDIVDTNSAFLCRKLKSSGITVIKTSAVRDDMAALVREIQSIASAADICVMTGGLGPTPDDLTAAALAEAAGVKIELDAAALESMKKYFDKRGFDLTPANEKQAMLPKGAKFLENLHGTAPGISMTINKCRFFCMPGVSREMERMFDLKVRPKLYEMTGHAGEIQIIRLMLFGMPESRVGQILSGFGLQFPEIHLGFRVRFPMIEVKLSLLKEVVSDSEEGMDGARQMKQAKLWVMEQLGSIVISDQGLTLAQEVGRLLKKCGQTLSVAESCTGGLVAHLITDVPGASDYFLFSATTYANSAKETILNVSRETLEKNGAVDETTALEMAIGVRTAGGSDWAVSTTGIAGPSGGTEAKPVGTVCIGVAGPSGSHSQRFLLDRGDRERNKQLFAAMSLEMLRRELVKNY